jgi:hypothetical protein
MTGLRNALALLCIDICFSRVNINWPEAEGQALLINDALIVTSAARAGMTLLTANRRDSDGLPSFFRLSGASELSSRNNHRQAVPYG